MPGIDTLPLSPVAIRCPAALLPTHLPASKVDLLLGPHAVVVERQEQAVANAFLKVLAGELFLSVRVRVCSPCAVLCLACLFRSLSRSEQFFLSVRVRVP